MQQRINPEEIRKAWAAVDLEITAVNEAGYPTSELTDALDLLGQYIGIYGPAPEGPEVFIEEFDSHTWGSWRKAIAARSARVEALEEAGYQVDTTTRYYGLRAERRGYRLIAHKDNRGFAVRMITPTTNTEEV